VLHEAGDTIIALRQHDAIGRHVVGDLRKIIGALFADSKHPSVPKSLDPDRPPLGKGWVGLHSSRQKYYKADTDDAGHQCGTCSRKDVVCNEATPLIDKSTR
jgi:hypothetical protein